MASYAIMRVQKLKTNTAVRGSLKHAFRAIDTPNADSSKLGENSHYGAGSVGEGMNAYKGLLPEKVRKNGVRCLEYLMTASPEKMQEMSREQQDAYFNDCKQWLEDMHGKEQVFYAGVHRDETTPHMYAYVVPLSQERDQEGNLVKPGKLNAREFIGGSSRRMSELQDEFAEKVGKAHDMERGVKGSKAKHKAIKTYYAELDSLEVGVEALKQPRMLQKGVFINKVETKQDVIDRVAQKAGELSHGATRLNQQVKEKNETISAMNERLKDLEAIERLPAEEKEQIKATAVMKAQEIKEAEAKKRPSRRSKRRSNSVER